MNDEIEMTLIDGSSVWFLKSQIISFSSQGSGTRIVLSNPEETLGEIHVRESYAEVTDMILASETTKPPGDFIE